MIWDVTTSFLTNRIAERTTAATRVDRTPVRLSETASDLLNTKWQGLKFDNANREDIFVYPGSDFLLPRPEADEPADVEPPDAPPNDGPSAVVSGRPPARALFADGLVLAAVVAVGAWAAVGHRARDSAPNVPAAAVPAPPLTAPAPPPATAEAPAANPLEKTPETPKAREAVVVKAQTANIRTKPDRDGECLCWRTEPTRCGRRCGR
ncbi:hypothetical protein [Azospirillum isscasi]|uniref:Uncharacterized protein n=1 Tax=Azospirillum isscasi TaxID=3053926 RepID=A0ABU0WFJ9_9PROT|nr:hypothetical protein [Azospirillum isscasi]MDQ2102857.1 hypothetical protein [Azospirillum isscasi]